MVKAWVDRCSEGVTTANTWNLTGDGGVAPVENEVRRVAANIIELLDGL